MCIICVSSHKTFFLHCLRRHPELPKIPTYQPTCIITMCVCHLCLSAQCVCHVCVSALCVCHLRATAHWLYQRCVSALVVYHLSVSVSLYRKVPCLQVDCACRVYCGFHA